VAQGPELLWSVRDPNRGSQHAAPASSAIGLTVIDARASTRRWPVSYPPQPQSIPAAPGKRPTKGSGQRRQASPPVA
jgi:hypothetical protein